MTTPAELEPAAPVLPTVDGVAHAPAETEPAEPSWPVVTLPTGATFTLGCELPSGAQVTFSDPTQLRAGDRKRIIRGLDAESGTMAVGLDTVDGTVALVVTGWTFPGLPIPSANVKVLDELSIPDYDALVRHVEPVASMLFPDQRPSKDTSSPTGPSNG